MASACRSFLLVHAPVAAWWLRFSGGYQASYPVPPPSAAWAFVCNVLGIWTWRPDDLHTPVRKDAPEFLVAVGQVEAGGRGTILQHMHTYPVGKAGREYREGCRGAKYFIEPATREIITDSTHVIGVGSDDAGLHGRLLDGLMGRIPGTRGALYAGSSDFLVDEVRLLTEPPKARWYSRLDPEGRVRSGTHRFPVYIDRTDEARSTWTLLAPTGEATPVVPDGAWTAVPGRG